MAKPRHFLTLLDFSPTELRAIIDRAIEMKADHRRGADQRQFPGFVLGMIFAKSSTRTRVPRIPNWGAVNLSRTVPG